MDEVAARIINGAFSSVHTQMLGSEAQTCLTTAVLPVNPGMKRKHEESAISESTRRLTRANRIKVVVENSDYTRPTFKIVGNKRIPSTRLAQILRNKNIKDSRPSPPVEDLTDEMILKDFKLMVKNHLEEPTIILKEPPVQI